ncbi:MAG: lipopolysaccharide biosynthesis protein [Bacteroidaceae bacterium]|nr:lipopolysaccharide biosynthesis protein [Bacteroidaceae bacterium]
MNQTEKTKRIAKNAVLLYIRMVVTLIITLFTSRIVLKSLGFDDFGLYNVIGGVVTLFAFLRSSMSSSTQRFLAYEMGSSTADNLRHVFCVCLTTHILLALVLFALAETIGLWFLNTHINIPVDREEAANWIYQFAVLSLCMNMVSLPYDADIVSNERMGYFAFLSILDAVLKLAIAYIVLYTKGDNLILYGALMMGISALNLFLNWIYCRMKFAETRFSFFWNKAMFLRIFSFSGWTIYGQLAVVGSNQGTNILVNIFHSVAANAAMGVGHQVNSALTGLVSNFQTAFKPQITKSYASGDYEYLTSLTNYASKISFFLLFLVSLPIILNIEWVLQLWLERVPAHAGELCIVFIIASLCNAVSAPLWMNIFATGRVRNYQLGLSAAYVAELIAVYVLFRMGYPLVVGVSMKAVLNFVVVFVRLYYTHTTQPQFSLVSYSRQVLLPVFCAAILTIAVSLPVANMTNNDLIRLSLTPIIVIVSIALAYFVGLNKREKKSLRNLIYKYKRHA